MTVHFTEASDNFHKEKENVGQVRRRRGDVCCFLFAYNKHLNICYKSLTSGLFKHCVENLSS